MSADCHEWHAAVLEHVATAAGRGDPGAILEAALGEMTPGATELPFEKVAARVPVSVRTVYRYFPTQSDLLAAVGAELEQRTGWHADTVTAENMAALTRELFVYLDKHFGQDESARPSTMDWPGSSGAGAASPRSNG